MIVKVTHYVIDLLHTLVCGNLFEGRGLPFWDILFVAVLGNPCLIQFLGGKGLPVRVDFVEMPADVD